MRLSSSLAQSALFPSIEGFHFWGTRSALQNGGNGPGPGSPPPGRLSRRRLPISVLIPSAPGTNLRPSHRLRPHMDVPGNLTDTKSRFVWWPDFHLGCFASLWTEGLARHLAGEIHLAEGSVRRPVPATPKGTGKQFQL